jgi:hypothetical protein
VEPALQRRVQFAVLLQIADHGSADRVTTAAMVAGTDERDLTLALENLLDDGSIEGETWRSVSLVELAAGGGLTLTSLGRQQLDEDRD